MIPFTVVFYVSYLRFIFIDAGVNIDSYVYVEFWIREYYSVDQWCSLNIHSNWGSNPFIKLDKNVVQMGIPPIFGQDILIPSTWYQSPSNWYQLDIPQMISNIWILLSTPSSRVTFLLICVRSWEKLSVFLSKDRGRDVTALLQLPECMFADIKQCKRCSIRNIIT